MDNLGYLTDIRPQKGQLVVFHTSSKMSQDWPVAMLDGEADLIPFMDGKILLGATHENTDGWDLTPTEEAYRQLIENPASLAEPQKLSAQSDHLQVGRSCSYIMILLHSSRPLPDDPKLWLLAVCRLIWIDDRTLYRLSIS